MSIELILFGVVALVLVLDFALRGVKKKNVQDDIERIGDEQHKKKTFNFNYILARKRNILTFILLVILFKPIVHYFFSIEYLEVTNSDKTYIGVNEPTYVLLDGIKISDTVYFHDFETGKSYFDKSQNRGYFFIGDNIFFKNKRKLSSIFYGKNKWIYSRYSTEMLVISKKIREQFKFRKNLINYLYKNSYDGFDIVEFQLLYDGTNRRFSNLYNGIILDSLEVDKWIHDGKIEKPEITLNYFPHIFNTEEPINLTDFNFVNFISFAKIPYSYERLDKIYTANGERIYFVGVANNEQTYNPYNDQWSFDGSWEKKFYYYKKTEREASFNFHFQNIFKLKLWLIAVSFASLGVLVLLFNDKIKAR